VVDLVRDGVLAYDDAGSCYPPLVFVHGAACNRRFWCQQVPRFCAGHRVVAVDLRGHGESGAPSERYTVRLFAEDLAWTCTQLRIESPVVIGHSLGGLVALDFASTYPDHVAAAGLIDSPLLPGGNRAEVVRDLVAGLRGRDPDAALRAYFASWLFGPYDDAATRSWILDQTVLTEPHVTSSLWEESLVSWDDEGLAHVPDATSLHRRRHSERRPGARCQAMSGADDRQDDRLWAFQTARGPRAGERRARLFPPPPTWRMTQSIDEPDQGAGLRSTHLRRRDPTATEAASHLRAGSQARLMLPRGLILRVARSTSGAGPSSRLEPHPLSRSLSSVMGSPASPRDFSSDQPGADAEASHSRPCRRQRRGQAPPEPMSALQRKPVRLLMWITR